MNRRYRPGDAVTVPAEFCPGCMTRTGDMAGLVTGFADEGDVSALFGDTPGPFYTVLLDHRHSGTGHLVYAEGELR